MYLVKCPDETLIANDWIQVYEIMQEVIQQFGAENAVITVTMI